MFDPVVAGLPTRLLGGLLIASIRGLGIAPADHGAVAVGHVLGGSRRSAQRVGGGCSGRGWGVATGDALLQAIEEGVVVLFHGSGDYCESELERFRTGW